MRVILALAAVLLVAVPSVLGQCADNTDATTGVEFLGVADDATSTADCPGGVGQATRLCTAGAFEAPDYSACRCAEEVVGVFTWPETTPSATAASLDCPSAGQATRVCSATTLIWLTPDTSACSCAAETDSAIDWEDATPSATAQTQACPGGVGDATRVCSTTTLDWETSDVSACKCEADEVTGIVWPESTPDNGNAVQVDCPGGSGTASRICSSTTLNWETPSTGDCKCAAEDASGISWDEEDPSDTAQSQNCPGGVGTATRVCSTATLNWAIPTTSACRCAAEENTGIQWTEATPSLTAQSKNCPGGVGTATRECNLTTLVWEDPVVTACKCAAETDPDTGISWPESSPSDTEVTQDCPSAGDAATRICSTTTLVWEDADLSDCECAGGEYYNVTWATTTPGSNDTNDCPDDITTSAHRYCSDVTYNWEEPDFSECFCAEDTYDSDTFNRTAAGETFNVTCANDDGHVSRTCNITTGTWDEPIEECGSGQDSPAASIAMPASVSFAVLIAGWLVMH